MPSLVVVDMILQSSTCKKSCPHQYSVAYCKVTGKLVQNFRHTRRSASAALNCCSAGRRLSKAGVTLRSGGATAPARNTSSLNSTALAVHKARHELTTNCFVPTPPPPPPLVVKVQLDMGVAEFKSARRWKNKSHSPPRRSSSESNLVFPSEVT